MSVEDQTSKPILSRRTLLGAMAVTAIAPSRVLAEPRRIVSLDYGLASTLLSMGVVPVGIADLSDWYKWMGEPKVPPGVIDMGSAWQANFEILTLIKPDLILTTPYLDALLPKLQAIAPVLRLDIYSPDAGPILPAAIRATQKLGSAIGQEAAAESFLTRSEAVFDRCRQRLSTLSPPPLALVNFMDARHVRIYGRPGLFANVLDRIGLHNAWAEQSNYWGFQTLSIEELSRVSARNAHMVAFEPIPADVLPTLQESPLWQELPFAQPGHFSTLPPALMFGMVNEAVRFAKLVTEMLEAQA